MIYNIALVFPEKISKQIYDFYKTMKDSFNPEFGLTEYSIIHATILKFETEIELNKDELYTILKNIEPNISIDLSGITLLPSHSSKGCWVELSILKSQELSKIQEAFIQKLSKYKLASGINNKFRPHITLAKTKDCNFDFKGLDYDILRETGINAEIAIGYADSTFEFVKL